MKCILTKEVNKRTESDFDFIVEFMKEINFFKNDKKLTYGEFRDIAASFEYERAAKGSELITYGTTVTNSDKFYIILSGAVKVMCRNPLISEWDWARNVYKALCEWKDKEFDKRVNKAMDLHFHRYHNHISKEAGMPCQELNSQNSLQKDGRLNGEKINILKNFEN